MDADLFSPADVAALLALREAAARRPLSAAQWQAAFVASGLVHEPAARPRALQSPGSRSGSRSTPA